MSPPRSQQQLEEVDDAEAPEMYSNSDGDAQLVPTTIDG
jgi:hypothetical protein